MDRYSKVVLTVIALALCIIVVQQAVKPAHAAPSLTRVAICDPNDPTLCAQIYTNLFGAGRAGLGVYMQR
jgi:hypothetical protein